MRPNCRLHSGHVHLAIGPSFHFDDGSGAQVLSLRSDAEVHAWTDVGHYVMEDAPERFLPLLRAFLERTA